MPVRQEIEKVNRLHRIVEHGPVALGGGDGEPARLTSDPNSDLAIIVLAVRVVGDILDHDALVLVVLVEHWMPKVELIPPVNGCK